jgi:hypothetical protein
MPTRLNTIQSLGRFNCSHGKERRGVAISQSLKVQKSKKFAFNRWLYYIFLLLLLLSTIKAFSIHQLLIPVSGSLRFPFLSGSRSCVSFRSSIHDAFDSVFRRLFLQYREIETSPAIYLPDLNQNTSKRMSSCSKSFL